VPRRERLCRQPPLEGNMAYGAGTTPVLPGGNTGGQQCSGRARRHLDGMSYADSS